MRYVLGALAAVTLLIGVAGAQPAEARCYGHGPYVHCWHPHHDWGWHRHAHDWR